MDLRKPIFDALRTALGGKLGADTVTIMDDTLDRLGVPKEKPVTEQTGRRVGAKGIALMHKWEGCELEAYPDPGSKDGKPWTIGWGSTGADIGPGTVWTQAQADARFERDLIKYADEVSRAICEAPTTQDQFDALVAFHYNTGAIRKATLTKLHTAGNFAGAAAEFGKWIYNDGKPMDGLRNRRADERRLYEGKWA